LYVLPAIGPPELFLWRQGFAIAGSRKPASSFESRSDLL
jgi:hypothetical protein